MNLTDYIHYYADADAIGIWWEKPDEAELIDNYELRLDGAMTGGTGKTHYTFEDLESERDYTVQLTAKNAEGLLLDDVVLHIQTPAKKERIVVTEAPYCAVGDSMTKNTLALQSAINDCPEGGTVIVPEGTYLTGALTLHSDMELYICEGAVLLGSTDPADYLPVTKGRAGGVEQDCYKSLINLGIMDRKEGPECRNVIIRGKGTIKGGGDILKKSETAEGAGALGGLIDISNCRDVRISSLTLADGPAYNVHMTYSLNVLTDHCVFRSGSVKDSNGWVPDSSENCAIFACTFFMEADSISIKSGKDSEENETARPSRKIRIFDCKSMFGSGISIGTEVGGGVENVRICDCDLERSTWGIQIIGTKSGGGYVRGLWAQDCVTPRLRAVPVDEEDDKTAREDPPDLGNFLFDRIKVTGRSLKNGEWRDCRSVEMNGFDKDHPIRNVLLRDVDIRGGLGVHTEFCENLKFEGDDD